MKAQFPQVGLFFCLSITVWPAMGHAEQNLEDIAHYCNTESDHRYGKPACVGFRDAHNWMETSFACSNLNSDDYATPRCIGFRDGIQWAKRNVALQLEVYTHGIAVPEEWRTAPSVQAYPAPPTFQHFMPSQELMPAEDIR